MGPSTTWAERCLSGKLKKLYNSCLKCKSGLRSLWLLYNLTPWETSRPRCNKFYPFSPLISVSHWNSFHGDCRSRGAKERQRDFRLQMLRVTWRPWLSLRNFSQEFWLKWKEHSERSVSTDSLGVVVTVFPHEWRSGPLKVPASHSSIGYTS